MSYYRGKEPTTIYSPEYQEGNTEKTRIAFRISNSDVSQAFDVDSVGIPREITVPQMGATDSGSRALFSFGVSISFGENQFYRTRVITVRPRVVLFNKCADTIRFRQAGTSESCAMDLLPGAVLPLHLQDREAPKNLVVSIPTGDANPEGTSRNNSSNGRSRSRVWSRGFSVSDIGNICLKVPVPGERYRFIWASISPVDVTKVVSFAPCADNETAYRIVNETGNDVTVAQNFGEGKSATPTLVAPRTSIPYAWDEPTRANRKLLVAISPGPTIGTVISPAPFFPPEAGRFQKPLNLDNIGLVKKLQVTHVRGKTTYTASVRLEGATKVLVISKDDAKGEGDSESAPDSKIPSRSTSPATGSTANSSSGAISRASQFTLNVELDGIGLSVTSTAPSFELLYATLTQIKFVHTSGGKKSTATLVVQGFQVDNQLYVTTYPVLIAGRPPRKERGERSVTAAAASSKGDTGKESSDMITFSAIKSAAKSSERVDHFQYLALQIGEFDLSLDEALLNHLILFLGLFNGGGSNSTNNAKDRANDRKGAGRSASRGGRQRDFLETVREKSSQRFEANSKVIYFELLHINPIRCNFSFAPMVESDDSGRLTNPVRELLGGMSFLSVERAPIALSALLLRNPFYSERQFAQVIGRYYRTQLLKQLYKVVFRLDCIGAPMMLWNFCGKGIYDFFYEPSLGMVKSTKDFAHGLGKGTISLVRNTVLGIFSSSSSLLGTLGKGVALLSMDQDYQRGHMLASTKDPRHLGEGLLFGAKDLGAGIIEGVAGMVIEPIKGARQEGLAGFVKGLGLGVVGAAVKPTVGALDMATQAAKGIINSATSGSSGIGNGECSCDAELGDDGSEEEGKCDFCLRRSRSRIRHPRYFDSDGILRPYNPELAEGSTLLCTISKGAYRNDVYVAHCKLDAKLVPKKKMRKSADEFNATDDDSDEDKPDSGKDYSKGRYLLITRTHVFVIPEFSSHCSTFTLKPLLTVKTKDIIRVERQLSEPSIKIILRSFGEDDDDEEEESDEDDNENNRYGNDQKENRKRKRKEKYEIVRGVPVDRINTIIAQISFYLGVNNKK